MENPFPNLDDRKTILPAGDGDEPHSALFLALGYLKLPELLSIQQVCRSFRDEIAVDELLWRHITIEPPLSLRLTDDILLRLTSLARGNLTSLSLLRCYRITDAGLLQVFDQNPMITKLCVPGCTSITADGVVRVVKCSGRLKYLRLHGLCNIKREHLNMLKSLLPKCSRQESSHSYFYSNWRSLPLHIDDGSPIDIDICPKCKNVGMVFDCTREDCRMMRNRWSPCRGCFFCIARCEECGGCLDAEELGEDTACAHLLCAGCWLQLPKCNLCNRPCCKEDRTAHGFSSAVFVCDNCSSSPHSSMASTEEDNKSASYPLYHKMILASISALGEERSGKSEISAYIETTYGDSLPENHEAALSNALEKMKEKGELRLLKNNYVQPDSSTASRRGRGRPPKPKQPLPPGVDPPTPRPRGRPPKPKDPLAAAMAKAARGLPRRRGRPPSKHRPSVGDSPAKPKTASLKPSVAGVKRGRGRPPKLREPASGVAVE